MTDVPEKIDLQRYTPHHEKQSQRLTVEGLLKVLKKAPCDGERYEQVADLIAWAWAAQEALDRLDELQHIVHHPRFPGFCDHCEDFYHSDAEACPQCEPGRTHRLPETLSEFRALTPDHHARIVKK